MCANRGDGWTRREALRSIGLVAASAVTGVPGFAAADGALLKRAVPSTGTAIPAVGLGTWQTFDVGTSDAERAPLAAVLKGFVEAGGAVVDTSPMYGRSEATVGALSAELEVGDRLFHATKVWTKGKQAGIEQMERSFDRMRVERMDLMQVHNLVDVERHLSTLADWKTAGRVRYVGVTHYTVEAYPALEKALLAHELDFVQLNHSVATREAERRLLPLAADRGVAVLVNRPYEGGDLFRGVRGTPVPEWAHEFGAKTWGQCFLKWILADPRVTCVIPATSNPEHLSDNMAAGRGGLPDGAQRAKLVRLLEG